MSPITGSVSVGFYDENNELLTFENTKKPIDFRLPMDPELHNLTGIELDPFIPPKPFEDLFYFTINVIEKLGSIYIEFNYKKMDKDLQVLNFIKFGGFPNITTRDWDMMQLIPKSMKETSKTDPSPMLIKNHWFN